MIPSYFSFLANGTLYSQYSLIEFFWSVPKNIRKNYYSGGVTSRMKVRTWKKE